MADDNIFKISYGYKKAFLALCPEIKKEIVNRFVSGESLTKISKSLSINRVVTTFTVKIHGIETNRNNKRRLTLNESAFSVITPESAYWIGFLMADGCISGNAVQLTLKSTDIEHIRKFSKFLKSSYKIAEFESVATFKDRPNYKKLCKACRIQFRSQKIVDDLSQYGVGPRKSFTAKVIGLENNPHFWRGAVDGDGSIGETIHRGVWGSIPWPVITLCGSLDMIQQFIEFVNTFHPNKRRVYKEPGKNLYNARYICKTAIKIIEVLYKDAPVALDRKSAKATYLLKYREDNRHKPLRKPEALKGW